MVKYEHEWNLLRNNPQILSDVFVTIGYLDHSSSRWDGNENQKENQKITGSTSL